MDAAQFGLVREEQRKAYTEELGERRELLAVPGDHVVCWDAYDETANALESFLIRHTRVSHV